MSFTVTVADGGPYVGIRCDTCGHRHHSTRSGPYELSLDWEARVDGWSAEGDSVESRTHMCPRCRRKER